MKRTFASFAFLAVLAGCDKKAATPTVDSAPTSPASPTSPANPTNPTNPTAPTNPTVPAGPTAKAPARKYTHDEIMARTHTTMRLKQIGFALLAFHDEKGYFPPADGAADSGFPTLAGLSWRAYVVRKAPSDLDRTTDTKAIKAWLDGETKSPDPAAKWNMPAIAAMRKDVFSSPSGGKAGQPWLTHYRVFVGGGAAFERGKVLGFADMKDGPENTLLVVAAAAAVPWPKPEELEYDPAKPLPKLDLYDDGTYGVFADGKVRFIAKDMPVATVRAWITRAGGEKVDLPPVPAVDSSGFIKNLGKE